MSYRIDAVTPALDAANSVVSLDASSTASGIGVQLLDDSGNVFPLGTTKVLSDYSQHWWQLRHSTEGTLLPDRKHGGGRRRQLGNDVHHDLPVGTSPSA
ncbi:hypothetical protein [Cupriavidus necator]